MATATSLAAAATAVSPLPTCLPRRSQVPFYSASLVLPNPRSPKSRLFIAGSQFCFGPLSAYCGLKHLGISYKRSTKEVNGRCRGRVVYASLFGVGAPEALVIGVVALLVFGPKGLAEVARNLGKTLRAFQPTIRELQEVSREFKSTLEREIGLDEVQSSLQSTYKPSDPVNEKPKSTIDPNGVDPTTTPYSTEDLLKITEEQLAAAGKLSYEEEASSKEQPQATQTSQEVAATSAAPEAAATPTLESPASEATVEVDGTIVTPEVAASSTAPDVNAASAGPEANFALKVTSEISSEEKQPTVQ